MATGQSRTDIINGALLKIGSGFVSDPAEKSESARTAGFVFERLARAELRAQLWSFALARAELPALADPPAWGYLNAFELPSAFLRLVQFGEFWAFSANPGEDLINEHTPEYAIEQNRVLCNEPAPLKIRYIEDKSDRPDTWDALFAEAFTCKLAKEIAFKLTKNAKLIQFLTAEYRSALLEAKRANAIELPPVSQQDGSWVEDRYW